MRKYLKRILKRLIIRVCKILFSAFYDKKYLTGKYFDNSLQGWIWLKKNFLSQRVFGHNKQVAWPACKNVHIVGDKIDFHPDDINNFQSFGIYYQAIANIKIGKGTYIAPNVGLITANHDLYDPDIHLPGEDIVIGEKCWIGMNAVILPGVVLGGHTVVGAGAVVTKSFPDGWCVLAGVPAKVIKSIESNGNV